jgi:anti-sigma factor RsiW
MTERHAHDPTIDELLVAFMDGELDEAERTRISELIETDEAVAARFDFLSASELPYRAAFEPMLAEAPATQLNAMLAALPSPLQQKSRATVWSSRRGFLAAAAACLVAGVVIDRTLLGLQGQFGEDADHDDSDWRAVVAQYMELYTPETLSALPDDPATQAAELRATGTRIGLSLTPQAVALSGLSFKRAQLLEYDGKPLAQIAYLDPRHGPVALCIVPSKAGQSAPEMESRNGMNVVYWSTATHAFMLIGHNPIDDLTAMADTARGNLATS